MDKKNSPSIKEFECPILSKQLTEDLITKMQKKLGDNYNCTIVPCVPGKVIVSYMSRDSENPNIWGVKCPEYDAGQKCGISGSPCYIRVDWQDE